MPGQYGIRAHIRALGVALTADQDFEGSLALTPTHIAESAAWRLTHPDHLRGNGPVLV